MPSDLKVMLSRWKPAAALVDSSVNITWGSLRVSFGVLNTEEYCFAGIDAILLGQVAMLFAVSMKGPIPELILLNFLAYEKKYFLFLCIDWMVLCSMSDFWHRYEACSFFSIFLDSSISLAFSASEEVDVSCLFTLLRLPMRIFRELGIQLTFLYVVFLRGINFSAELMQISKSLDSIWLDLSPENSWEFQSHFASSSSSPFDFVLSLKKLNWSNVAESPLVEQGCWRASQW